MSELLSRIDEIYRKYEYDVKIENSLHIYEYKKTRYFGVDFVNYEECDNFEEIKNGYSDAGFAWKQRDYKSSIEAELELFRSTFQIDALKRQVSSRYNQFVLSQEDSLPDKAKYEYVNGKFTILEYENGDYPNRYNSSNESLATKVGDILRSKTNKPHFVIIEAAAGYGKTCSALELLKLLNGYEDVIPLYIELSRNREARIFKHILWHEIEKQFYSSVSSEIVIHEIKKGRIPLIIDGFDELLSQSSSSSYDEVLRDSESLLATIIELLEDDAKIIITSRKTAIFNSEDFYNLMENTSKPYHVSRFTLAVPEVKDWIPTKHYSLIERSFPIQEIANPVLLSYVKNLSYEELEGIINSSDTLLEKYFDFLMIRERTRQGYTFSNIIQKQVLGKLAKLMVEFRFNSESKDIMKEFILEGNKDILIEYVNKCESHPKPTIEELADKFSNHALLDRKENGTIGFINEFIFGCFIGQNIVDKVDIDSFVREISEEFAMQAVDSYRVQTKLDKQKLHDSFKLLNVCFDSEFDLSIDTVLAEVVDRKYSNGIIDGISYDNVVFGSPAEFVDFTFNGCTYNKCIFDKSIFVNCTFIKCEFYQCEWSDNNGVSRADTSQVNLIGCSSDNDFANEYDDTELSVTEVELTIDEIEERILAMYYRDGIRTTQIKKLSSIQRELQGVKIKSINKAISNLDRKKFIILDGGNCFIQKDGITHYRNLSK